MGRFSEVVTAASWFCRCAPCSDFSSTGTLLSTRTSKLVEMSSWAATSARADLGQCYTMCVRMNGMANGTILEVRMKIHQKVVITETALLGP